MSNDREFGFLPRAFEYSFGDFRVEPLPDCLVTIEKVLATGRISQDWLYPPLVPAPHHPRREGEPPLIPATSFAIDPTHRMVHKTSAPHDDELLEFLVTVLGLATGLRLVPSPWVHFYRAAITLGRLVDFQATSSDIEGLVERAHDFWLQNSSPTLRKAIFGAVHWHLFGRSYVHPFEEFNAQYIVLDTCWHIHSQIHRISGLPHGLRPLRLCQSYDLHVPDWAQVTKNSCALASIRNALVHEGRYGDDPIGFGDPGAHDNVDYELTLFNTRLLLAMMGLRSRYTRSPVNTRQTHLLD